MLADHHQSQTKGKDQFGLVWFGFVAYFSEGTLLYFSNVVIMYSCACWLCCYLLSVIGK